MYPICALYMHIYLYIEAKHWCTIYKRQNDDGLKPQTIIVYTLFKCNDYDNDTDN